MISDAFRAELAAAAKAELEAHPPVPATAVTHPITAQCLQEAAQERQRREAKPAA